MKKIQFMPLVGLLCIYYILEVSALSCLPCKETSCPPEPKCENGSKILGICGCCKVCAKIKGEVCGGPFNIKGRCDDGLFCNKSNSIIELDFNADGICTCNLVTCNNSCLFGYKVVGNSGCPTCECNDPPFPKCSSWFKGIYAIKKRKTNDCTKEQTVFCSRSCKRCCVNEYASPPKRLFPNTYSECKSKWYGQTALL